MRKKQPKWDMEVEWRRIAASLGEIYKFVRDSPSRQGRDPDQLAHDIVRETVLRCWRNGIVVRNWVEYMKLPAFWIMNRKFPIEQRICIPFQNLNLKPQESAELRADRAPGPVDQVLGWEMCRSIRRHLDGLPRQQRRVLHLVLMGFSNAEISSELGMQPGAVRHNKHRGLKALRQELGRAA